MKITIFGVGYVGLVQGAVLADSGHQVCCVDVDQEKIDNLKNGTIPIYEPGLEELVCNNYEAGRLLFTTDIKAAVNFGKVLFIAVGTPPDEDGSADLRHVLNVAASIAEHMVDEKIVVNKSTVPVGTSDRVAERINQVLAEHGKNIAFEVVSNPEFLKEGAAVSDCQRPDRIVIGTTSRKAEAVMRELYKPYNRNHEKIIVMDPRSAELTKYAANCMLATKISFMNEMANIAEKVGADIECVRQGIGSDPRIGFQFIYPGCGYGGSCFPKDIKALIKTASNQGFDTNILNAVELVNDRQKVKLYEYMTSHYENQLSGKVFALWGLAFKPNTDDIRDASSCVLIELLLAAGAKIQAYDPEAMEEIRKRYPDTKGLLLMESKEAALKEADGLVICTEWNAFRSPDFDELGSQLNDRVIFDGRNLYDPVLMKEKGFIYYSIGRTAHL